MNFRLDMSNKGSKNIPKDKDTVTVVMQRPPPGVYASTRSPQLVALWNDRPGKELGRHCDVVKLECLAPFLFKEAKQADCWINWAIECGILSKKWDSQQPEITENVLKNVELMETAIQIVTNTIKGKDTFGMIIMLEILEGCRKQKNAEDVLNYVNLLESKESKFIKKWISKFKSLFKTDKDDAVIIALLLVAEQYREHIEALIIKMEDLVEQFEEDQRQAEQNSERMKNTGNEDFKAGNYLRAITNYTKAILINKYSHILYSNRAQAYLKKRIFDKALLDGKCSVILKPDWPKAWYRYAEAYYEMGSYRKSQEINTKALEACKNCGEFKELLVQKEKIKEKIGELNLVDGELPDLYASSETSESSVSSSKNKKKKKIKKSESPTVKGLPDLVDATDSDESESALSDGSAPDLVTDSESDGDDNDVHKKESTSQNKKSNSKKKKAVKSQEQIDDEVRSEFMENLKQGSLALLDERYRASHRDFEKSIVLLGKYSEKFFRLEETEYLVIQYAVCEAEIGTGNNDDIVRAISKLTKITTQNKSVFIMAYYGLGKAYLRQNRFEMALPPLERGLKIAKNRPYCVLTWPGTKIVMEITKKGKLELAFESLMDKCLHPPTPDAVCRYIGCNGYYKKEIYFNDPDFKGMIRMTCFDKCILEYHPNCWKKVKSDHKFSDKEFIGEECSTPDCKAQVTHIQIYGNDTTVTKELTPDAQPEKFKDNAAKAQKKQPALPSLNQKKLTKKQRKKEQKNTATQATSSTKVVKEEDHKEDKDVPGTSHAESKKGKESLDSVLDMLEAKADEKEEDYCDSVQVEDEVSKDLEQDLRNLESEAVVVMKKDEDDFEDFIKPSQKNKKKKRKDKGQRVLSLDEFNGPQESNHQPSSMFNAVLDPDTPFAEHKQYNLLTVNQHQQPTDEEAKRVFLIKENLFSYFNDLLEAHGPLNIKDDLIQSELYTFPTEAQAVITNSGGLENLLKECLKFASMDGYLCLLKDAVKARQMVIDKQNQAQSTWQTVGNGISGNRSSVALSVSAGSEITLPSSASSVVSGYSGGESSSRPGTPKSSVSSLHSRPSTPSDTKLGKSGDSRVLKGSDTDLNDLSKQHRASYSDLVKTSKTSENDIKNEKISNITEPLGREKKDNFGMESDPVQVIEFTEKVPDQENAENFAGNTPVSAQDIDNSFQQRQMQYTVSLPNLHVRNDIAYTHPVQHNHYMPYAPHGFIQPTHFYMNNPPPFYAPQQQYRQNIVPKNENCVQVSDFNSMVSGTGRNDQTENNGGTLHHGPAGDAGNDLGSAADKLDSFYVPNSKPEPIPMPNMTFTDVLDYANGSDTNPGLPNQSRLQQWTMTDDKNMPSKIPMIDVAVMCCVETRDVAIVTDETFVSEEDFYKLLSKNETNSLNLKQSKDKLTQLDSDIQEKDKRIKDLEEALKKLASKYETLVSEFKNQKVEKKNISEELKSAQEQLAEAQSKEIRLFDDLVNKNSKIEELSQTIEKEREKAAKDIQQSESKNSAAEQARSQKAEIAILTMRMDMAKKALHAQLQDAESKLTNINKYLQSCKERNKPPHDQAVNDLNIWKRTVAKCQQQLATTQEAFKEQIRLIQSGQSLASLPDINLPNLPTSPGGTPNHQAAAAVGSSGGHFRQGFGPKLTGPPRGPPVRPEGLSHHAQQMVAARQMAMAASVGGTQTAMQRLDHPPPPGLPGGRQLGMASGRPQIPMQRQSNNNFSKIMAFLQKKFPHVSHDGIIQHIQTLRAQNNNSMSGLTLDQIVSRVSDLITQSIASKKTDANSVDSLTPVTPPFNSPMKLSKSESEFSEIFREEEDPCIICHEELALKHQIQLKCSHRYHHECIRRWLNTNSTCPTCRVHVLLDDEFPSLGK